MGWDGWERDFRHSEVAKRIWRGTSSLFFFLKGNQFQLAQPVQSLYSKSTGQKILNQPRPKSKGSSVNLQGADGMKYLFDKN